MFRALCPGLGWVRWVSLALRYPSPLKGAARMNSSPRGFPYPGPVYKECFWLRTTGQGQSKGEMAGGQGKLLQTLGGTLLSSARSLLPCLLAQTQACSGCTPHPSPTPSPHPGPSFTSSPDAPPCCGGRTRLVVLQTQVQVLFNQLGDVQELTVKTRNPTKYWISDWLFKVIPE